MAMKFKHNELLKESSRQARGGRCSQAVVYSVGHPGVKKIELRMSYQPFALAFHPRLKTEIDEGIFQDFVI